MDLNVWEQLPFVLFATEIFGKSATAATSLLHPIFIFC